MNKDTAIIIPVYNEAKVIKSVIDEVTKQYQTVICVDDGSKDDSAQEILASNATLVRHPVNLGQGAALQTGIEYALQDPSLKYFVTYDADGQHSLEDVTQMLKLIKKTRVDIVLGSRFLGKTENISPMKKVILKLAIIFSNKTSGLKLTDAHNGLRVFNRQVAEKLNITMPDYSHASEIIERMAEEKFTYVEAPVTIVYTEYARQKGQSIFNAVNIAFDMLIWRMHK